MAKNRRGKKENTSAPKSVGAIEKRKQAWAVRSKAGAFPTVQFNDKPGHTFIMRRVRKRMP